MQNTTEDPKPKYHNRLQRKTKRYKKADPYYKRKKHKKWRAAVLRRAGYQCEECKRYGKNVDATVAHHIKPREEYPELEADITNGQALCASCHNKKHPEKGSPPPYRKLY